MMRQWQRPRDLDQILVLRFFSYQESEVIKGSEAWIASGGIRQCLPLGNHAELDIRQSEYRAVYVDSCSAVSTRVRSIDILNHTGNPGMVS